MDVKKQFMCIYLMTWASFCVLIVFFLSCLEKDLFKSVTHVVGDMPWWACRNHRTVLWGWFLPSTTQVPGSELGLSDLCNKCFTYLLLSHLSSSSYPVFHLAPCFCVVGLIHLSIYLVTNTLLDIWFTNTSSHSLDYISTFFIMFLKQKCHFDEAQFTWVSPLILLLLSYLRDHCLFQDEECVPTCFLLRFIVLALIFKSLIHFELIFAYHVK